MWRHEDVFFGAMGGAGGGGKPITTPEEIAERCRESRTRCVPGVPVHARHRALDGLQRAVHGRHGRHPRRAPPRRARAVASSSSASSANFIVIVGDAFARPDARRARHRRRARASTCRAARAAVGRRDPLAALKRALVERLPGVLVVDGYGASETGGQGQSVVVVGRRRPERAAVPRVGDDTQVLGDDLRPGRRRASSAGSRAAVTIPLGYYKDPEKTAATFPVVDGVRWAVPGDHAVVETDGSITLLGRGSVSINTGGEKVYPEEVESVLKAHADVVRRGRRRRPRRALGRAGRRGRAAARRRPQPTLDALQEHARGHLAGYKVPRELVLVDAIVRSPSGKPDYRWAKATAATARRRTSRR